MGSRASRPCKVFHRRMVRSVLPPPVASRCAFQGHQAKGFTAAWWLSVWVGVCSWIDDLKWRTKLDVRLHHRAGKTKLYPAKVLFLGVSQRSSYRTQTNKFVLTLLKITNNFDYYKISFRRILSSWPVPAVVLHRHFARGVSLVPCDSFTIAHKNA